MIWSCMRRISKYKQKSYLTEVINSRVVYPVYGQFCIWPFSLPFDTHNEIFWSPEYFHQILSGFGDIGQSFKMPKMGPKMENQRLIGQFSYEILKIGVYDLVWAKSWWPKPKRPIRPKIGRFGWPTAVWPAASLEKNARGLENFFLPWDTSRVLLGWFMQ